MSAGQDAAHMARALHLAARGRCTTRPNPAVGCVLVHDGEVVGEGWHQRAGGSHAEVHALQQAGERARGATAYVSLEPCSHHGRTPPCTQALIAAGVARVVAAMEDPNPLVAGQGMTALRQAGIAAETGLCAPQAAALNAGFIRRMTSGLPRVRVKLGMSLDGRTAMASGESKWITGPAARSDVMRLRAESGAIITGIGTVLADDPNLTVRAATGLPESIPPPLRVVLDPWLSTPRNARILDNSAPTLLVTSAANPDDRATFSRAVGMEVLHLPARPDAIALEPLLRELARREINDVLVETGATLAGGFLQAGLVDELVLYVAPKLMGARARGLFDIPGLERLTDAVALDISDIRAVGPDWRVTARVQR
jgi:diaminohydroxyphosphoribosylaminopyrimidine deaminase/5-amino-6-(5-phosphoribosylamino)uracil reductase